ncbi:MAG: GNAT family N-acetyltransferase [Candidatus Cryptobacteroides sp.]
MNITFERLSERDYKGFCNDVKDVFSVAVVETFGQPENGREIISQKEVSRILKDASCEAYTVYADGLKIGGVAIRPDTGTGFGFLVILYVYPEYHGKGLGVRIWQGIEQLYPTTKVWRLVTPYFEKRNIHFYVNKCGFKIVEFFNKAHRDPDYELTGLDFHDEYFLFEKVMEEDKRHLRF